MNVDSPAREQRNKEFGCALCKDPHPLWKCEKFKEMSVVHRRNCVKETRVCFNCLGVGHRAGDCVKTFRCRTCNRKHHSLLHDESMAKTGPEGTKNSDVESTS